LEISLEKQVGQGSAQAVIRVRDHGPGVPEQHLESIFQPFFRVAEARERGTGGTGVGLAITRRAIQIHGGTVRAFNAEVGLIVEISLPA
jgi:two-component system sensor histidine kinase CpxA